MSHRITVVLSDEFHTYLVRRSTMEGRTVANLAVHLMLQAATSIPAPPDIRQQPNSQAPNGG